MIAPVPSHPPTGASPSDSRLWEPVPDSQNMVMGQRYRLRMTIQAPYTAANIKKLEDTLRLGTGVNNLGAWLQLKQTITIEQFIASYPKSTITGATPTWTFTMIFTKTGGGTPLAVIIGLVALVVTLSILASVVSHTIEKEGGKIGSLIDTTAGAAKSTIFNPFFIIAAVIVVLAIKGRSLKSIRG